MEKSQQQNSGRLRKSVVHRRTDLCKGIEVGKGKKVSGAPKLIKTAGVQSDRVMSQRGWPIEPTALEKHTESGLHFEGDGKALKVLVIRFREKDSECGFRYVDYRQLDTEDWASEERAGLDTRIWEL